MISLLYIVGGAIKRYFTSKKEAECQITRPKFTKRGRQPMREKRRQIFVNAQWLLPKLPKHDDESESEEDCEMPDAIQNMMDAEVMDRVVVIK
uniref:Uncharacterized protein n=1 Tax=Magallana gigas TaxID=29159 RepID=K1PEN5_MAGGI